MIQSRLYNFVSGINWSCSDNKALDRIDRLLLSDKDCLRHV